MGVIIEAIASARSRGSLRAATTAATRALRLAGRAADEVGLLINAGVYPDDCVVEPANAAFIQRRIGANPEPGAGGATLSFDLNNGGCGFLTAIEVAEGFLGSGEVDLALVVASDADPARGGSGDFPFEGGGVAALLSRGVNGEGFAAHASRSVEDFADRYSGRLEFERVAGQGNTDPEAGRYRVAVQQKADFAVRGAECAAPLVRELLSEHGECGAPLMVASPHPAGFAAELASQLEGVALLPCSKAHARLHTAGIGTALEAALRSGEATSGRPLLLVGLGGGITVAATLYLPGEREPAVAAGSS